MSLTKTQQTLFYPLIGRAEAARTWPELFSDSWAEQAREIALSHGVAINDMPLFSQASYGLRHIASIAEIKAYLANHPEAAVVNLGCGLDRLEEDLAEIPHGPLYNLDFPEVIELRKRWLPASDSIELPFSAFDFEWMKQVDARGGFVALAAGVMYFFEIEQATALIDAMGRQFPGGEFIYDAQSPDVTSRSERVLASAGLPATMPFKLADPYCVRDWSPAISNVEIDFNFMHYLPHGQRELLPPDVADTFMQVAERKDMYVVKVEF